jgi:hypothetical protein
MKKSFLNVLSNVFRVQRVLVIESLRTTILGTNSFTFKKRSIVFTTVPNIISNTCGFFVKQQLFNETWVEVNSHSCVSIPIILPNICHLSHQASLAIGSSGQDQDPGSLWLHWIWDLYFSWEVLNKHYRMREWRMKEWFVGYLIAIFF